MNKYLTKLAGMADVLAKGKSMLNTASNSVKPLVADAKLQGSRLIGRDSVVGGSKLTAAKALVKNPLVAGTLGAAAVGGAALAMRNREKKAAFDALIEAGVDFNEAATLVANKATEIYGE